MLRNSFLIETFKDGKNKEYKYADEDENYMVNINRPITEKALADLPSSKMDKLIDKILTDRKISNVLYNSVAIKEINNIKKSNQKLIQLTKKPEKKRIITENNPSDIVNNRKKKEMIEEIKQEVKQNKKYQVDQLNMQKKLNEDYRKFFQKEKNKEFEIEKIALNKIRLDRFEIIFKSLTDKILESLDNGKRKGCIFNNINFELSDIKLPEIKLDMHNVFSRLFHNEVLLSPKKGQNFTENNNLNNLEIISPNKNNNNSENNFVVKNVIESANGKEFTIKITDEIFAKCFSKYSGGPKIDYHKVNNFIFLFFNIFFLNFF
jgi:hypothetical protein